MDSTAQDEVKRPRRCLRPPTSWTPGARADVEIILLTGRAMDFATRLKGHSTFVGLSHELVHSSARYAPVVATSWSAPSYRPSSRPGLVDYTLGPDGSTITHIEEYVGVSGTITQQTAGLLNVLSSSCSDLAVLHSVEVGAVAPLARSQHLEQLVRRGAVHELLAKIEDALTTPSSS